MEASPHAWPVLGSLLLRDGLLTEDELEAALAQQRISGKRLGEVLLNRGTVTATQIARLLAEQYELPFIEFAESEIEQEAVALLPEDLARRHAALPVSFLTDGRLVVAIADPSSVLYSEELRAALGVPLRFAISSPDAIQAGIASAYANSAGASPEETVERSVEAREENEDRALDQRSGGDRDGEPSERLPHNSTLDLTAGELDLDPRDDAVAAGETPAESTESVVWQEEDPGEILNPVGPPFAEEEEPRPAAWETGLDWDEPAPTARPESTESTTPTTTERTEGEEIAVPRIEERGVIPEAAGVPSTPEQDEEFSPGAWEHEPGPDWDEPASTARSEPAESKEPATETPPTTAETLEGQSPADREEPALTDDEPLRRPEQDTRPPSSPLAVVVDIYSGESNPNGHSQVEETIERALLLGASDVHFTPQPHGLVVRGRVDGVVRDLEVIPLSERDDVTERLKVLGQLKVGVRRTPQHGRFAWRVGDDTVDLRITVLPTTSGEKVTLSAPKNGFTPHSLSDLGMASENEEAVRSAIREPGGVVLACGPAGAGRTTTIYAALRELNTRDRVIATIEEPVEHVMPGTDQTAVDPAVGMNLSRGLRAVRGSDPDVIMISEIRDRETARLTLDAAASGRLILSTLHAQTAATALQRLADMEIEPGLLGATLSCLTAQRLARRVCRDCRETYYADPEDATLLARPDEEVGRRLLARGHGCATCGGTGYRGQVGLFEVLPLTEEIRTLVAKRASTTEIERAAVEAGMKTLRDDGTRLCLEGITTTAELRRVTGDPTVRAGI